MDGSGANDEATLDALILGAQSTIGDFTVNGTFYQESNDDGNSSTTDPEPSLFTLGGRWSAGPFYLGGTFFAGDNDIDNPGASQADSPTAVNVLAGMDFGGGYSGYVGVGSGSADRDDGNGDMSTAFLQAQKELSSRTKIYGEFETATIEGTGTGGNDRDNSVLAVGVLHSF
jgi:hypothetical protein